MINFNSPITPTPEFIQFLFIVGGVYFLCWLFAFGSLLARSDLEGVEKLMWVVVMTMAPLGLIFYLALAPSQAQKKIDRANSLSGTPWENNPGHTSRSNT